MSLVEGPSSGLFLGRPRVWRRASRSGVHWLKSSIIPCQIGPGTNSSSLPVRSPGHGKASYNPSLRQTSHACLLRPDTRCTHTYSRLPSTKVQLRAFHLKRHTGSIPKKLRLGTISPVSCAPKTVAPITHSSLALRTENFNASGFLPVSPAKSTFLSTPHFVPHSITIMAS